MRGNNEVIQDEIPYSENIDISQSLQKIEVEPRKFDNQLNDFQFAFYKNIVENEWIYEKASDRNRIGFEKHAIDESKISLADIEVLIKSGAIFQEQVQHPTGSFKVYSAIKNIESKLIFETIRRITRKRRLKFIKRKIDFPNWLEFGLAKQKWQFDFEVPQVNIIGSIWTKDCFVTPSEKTERKLLSEKKNELKALIAAATLKLKDEGIAVIITSLEDDSHFLKKMIKSTGWGDVKVISFSDHNFFNDFTKLLKK